MGTSSPISSPFSDVGSFALSFPISYVSTALFWIAVFATLITAVILYYHWIRYGVGVVGTMTVMVVYAIGVAILLLAALGLLTQL